MFDFRYSGNRLTWLSVYSGGSMMKNLRNNLGLAGMLSALTLFGSGCVERRIVYVPSTQPPPAVVYQSGPAVVQAPAPPPGTATPPPPDPTAPVVVSQIPPAPPVEVIPPPPSPEYAWTPGYWTWQGRWVWVRGVWVVPPRPHAVWGRGHWARHGRGYVWVGGSWR